MRKIMVFISVFSFSGVVSASTLEIDSSHITAVIPNMNTQLCKSQATMLSIIEGNKELEALLLEKIASASDEERPALEKTLETLRGTFESTASIIEKNKKIEFGAANIQFPSGASLPEEVKTTNGKLAVWMGNPISQVRFIGPDICAFIDLEQETLNITDEVVAEFINSLKIQN